MSDAEHDSKAINIAEAIRAKRDRTGKRVEDIEALEASLVADIESFDLARAEREARGEQAQMFGAGLSDETLVYPEIDPAAESRKPVTEAAASIERPAEPAMSPLLEALRREAMARQGEAQDEHAAHSAANQQIDQALKQAFFYLHDFVQQLNVIKPPIPREFPLIDQQVLRGLSWTEGFVDYRTQSHSRGALIEMVSFSYRLLGPDTLFVERDGPVLERFRALLFDYGLPFECREFRNERRYVERGEFEIRSELSVSARWRADFAKRGIVLETRNLERLGTALLPIRPEALDQALIEEFGRLVLGQPNRFRELARR